MVLWYVVCVCFTERYEVTNFISFCLQCVNFPNKQISKIGNIKNWWFLCWFSLGCPKKRLRWRFAFKNFIEKNWRRVESPGLHCVTRTNCAHLFAILFSVTSHWPYWEYLHHRNWQTLQISDLESWRLDIYQHTTETTYNGAISRLEWGNRIGNRRSCTVMSS